MNPWLLVLVPVFVVLAYAIWGVAAYQIGRAESPQREPRRRLLRFLTPYGWMDYWYARAGGKYHRVDWRDV